MNPAIEFEHVSKRFRLHNERPRSFQEALIRSLHRNGESRSYDLWVLRDLNLTIPAGQTVGVIGPNGAGKSTLLKLVSRILEPTSGQVRTYGRVAGLLEVGTGFHPDLTGRENIFLNGSILGLKRSEISRRFDAIVEFSGVGSFLDVPVRHYSSGMHMRLGFAVATSVDADILLIDEVLAVGDQTFQAQCLARIRSCSDGASRFCLSLTIWKRCESSAARRYGCRMGRLRLMAPSTKSLDVILAGCGEG